MSKVRKQFAKNLQAIRKQRRMTQEQLAKKLRISVRYIQHLEGRLTPNVKIDTLSQIAKVLNVKVCDLVRGI